MFIMKCLGRRSGYGLVMIEASEIYWVIVKLTESGDSTNG